MKIRGVIMFLCTVHASMAVGQNEFMDYVSDALDLIERHALRSTAVDWPSHRRFVLQSSADAADIEEAYDLIDQTLAQLSDNHSKLIRPAPARTVGRSEPAPGSIGGYAGMRLGRDSFTVLSVDPQTPAGRAGLQRGDRILAVNGQTVTPENAELLHDRAGKVGTRLLIMSTEGRQREVVMEPGSYTSGLAPSTYLFYEKTAVLELPAYSGGGEIPGLGSYAGIAHQAIAEQSGACGWVVDLRLNSGGNMWPMLAAVGPLLGPGTAGGSLFSDGESWAWAYAEGSVTHGGFEVLAVAEPVTLATTPPVAVLTGPVTASSGEAVTIAFRRRPETRFFGEATAGVPTVNRTMPLPDGATLHLTVGRFVDRAGFIYESSIEPDEIVPIEWDHYGTPLDPVLVAAIDWLAETAACR